MAGNWSKSLLAVQWAVQDSQRFCLRINFAWDQRDWTGEVVARWNDFNSQQLNSFPWLRPQPCIPCSAKRWSWTMSVLTKVSWSLGSRTVLTRPTQERICSFFRGKEASAVFPYTYLTEEQPAEHNAYFPIESICGRLHHLQLSDLYFLCACKSHDKDIHCILSLLVKVCFPASFDWRYSNQICDSCWELFS